MALIVSLFNSVIASIGQSAIFVFLIKCFIPSLTMVQFAAISFSFGICWGAVNVWFIVKQHFRDKELSLQMAQEEAENRLKEFFDMSLSKIQSELDRKIPGKWNIDLDYNDDRRPEVLYLFNNETNKRIRITEFEYNKISEDELSYARELGNMIFNVVKPDMEKAEELKNVQN